eukprot:219460_1
MANAEQKYNEDIIEQMVLLQIATKKEIIIAMENVTNPNDINEVMDYITNQQEILDPINNDVKADNEVIKGDTFKKIDYAFYKFCCSKNEDYIKNKKLYFNENGVGKIYMICYKYSYADGVADHLENITEDKIEKCLEKCYPSYGIAGHLAWDKDIASLSSLPWEQWTERRKELLIVLKNCYANMYYYDTKDNSDGFIDEFYSDIECNSISNCKYLRKIINILKHFTSSDNINTLKLINQYLHKQERNNLYDNLVSMYHHVIHEHLCNNTMSENKRNFQYIHELISENNVQCDIDRCSPYIRNNRNREQEVIKHDDPKTVFLMDLIDSMHVYFIHSYDNGFRTPVDFFDDILENNISDELEFEDKELLKLSLHLKEKRKKLFEIRGISKKNQNKSKYITVSAVADTGHANETTSMEVWKDKLVQRGMDASKWDEFIEDEEFDTDSIEYDCIHGGKNANIYYFFKSICDDINALVYFQMISRMVSKNIDVEYAFGQAFCYWEKDKDTKWFITPKYLDLKQEILAHLPLEHFNNIYFKAKTYLNESNTLKKMKSTYHCHMNGGGITLPSGAHQTVCYGFVYVHDLPFHSPLQIGHIMAVLFYTNFTELSYNFSKSFRKLEDNETDESLKKRNSVWCNMSKLLREAVECYGDDIGSDLQPKPNTYDKTKDVYFHGVSYLYFNKFVANLSGPTSTTMQIEVASIFAKDGGLILELQRHSGGDAAILRSFNCSIISCYNNEDERIFFGGAYPIQFKSIRILRPFQNLENFIHVLTSFNAFITDSGRKTTKKHGKVIESLINNPLDNKFPVYIQKCFQAFRYEKKAIHVRMGKLPEAFSMFLSSAKDHLLNFSLLAYVFPNVETIECMSYIGDYYNSFLSFRLIDDLYIKGLIEEIKKIQNNKQSKLNEVTISTQSSSMPVTESSSRTSTPSKELDLCSSSFESLGWKIQRTNSTTFLDRIIFVVKRIC